MRPRFSARVLKIAAAVLLALVALAMIVSIVVSRPIFAERLERTALATIPIAPLSDALTFARYRRDGGLHAMLVTRYDADRVVGADLGAIAGVETADPLWLLRERGYDGLAALGASAPAITVNVAELGLPFDAPAENIGIGTNYREHAREAGLDE